MIGGGVQDFKADRQGNFDFSRYAAPGVMAPDRDLVTGLESRLQQLRKPKVGRKQDLAQICNDSILLQDILARGRNDGHSFFSSIDADAASKRARGKYRRREVKEAVKRDQC